MVMQYGSKFLSPGKDVFSEERATGFANRAYQSNFLHPVLYYFKSLPDGKFINIIKCGQNSSIYLLLKTHN